MLIRRTFPSFFARVRCKCPSLKSQGVVLQARTRDLLGKAVVNRSGKISHYRILEKLGAGGMGVVYLAEDMKLGRKVAIKILSHEFTTNKDRAQSLLNEARSAYPKNTVINTIVTPIIASAAERKRGNVTQAIQLLEAVRAYEFRERTWCCNHIYKRKSLLAAAHGKRSGGGVQVNHRSSRYRLSVSGALAGPPWSRSRGGAQWRQCSGTQVVSGFLCALERRGFRCAGPGAGAAGV